MKKVGDATKDRELKYLVKTVLKYQHDIPELIDQIRARHVDVLKQDMHKFEGIFFMTAHRSKGLEFTQVILTDDYTEFVDDFGEPLHPSKIDQQEVNVQYVALTRAEEVLVINRSFAVFLRALQEYGLSGPINWPLGGGEEVQPVSVPVTDIDETPTEPAGPEDVGDEPEWCREPVETEPAAERASVSEQDEATQQEEGKPDVQPDFTEWDLDESLSTSDPYFYLAGTVSESDYA